MGEPFELEDFLNWKPPKLDPIISDGLMYTGCKVIIYGKVKSGKSVIASRLGLALSKGLPWLGFTTTKQSVMYLQLEIIDQMLQERMMRMIQPGTNHAPFYIWTEPTIKIDTDEGYNKIAAMIEKYHPQVLIIDPIYKIVSGDLLSTTHIQKLTDWIDKLIADYNLAIALVHHAKKGVFEEWGSDDMLGSVIFSAWADSVIKVERQVDNKVLVKFETVRHAQIELPPRLFNYNAATMDYVKAIRSI